MTPKKPSYKSRGENLIAKFLKDTGLKYHYEYPLMVIDDDGKMRIWYPDFWIPELSIVIEYFGMMEDEQYRELVKKKELVYKSLNIDMINVFNWTVQESKNWEKFIIMRMIEIMDSKDPLYHKLYKLKQKYTRVDETSKPSAEHLHPSPLQRKPFVSPQRIPLRGMRQSQPLHSSRSQSYHPPHRRPYISQQGNQKSLPRKNKDDEDPEYNI